MDNSKQMTDKIKKEVLSRYLIKVNLSSARNIAPREAGKQYYFETGKKRRQRTPTMGYFEFNFASMSDLKEPLNLFSELISISDDKLVEVMLELKERNHNPLKVDESITRMKLSMKVGEKRRSFTIADGDLELRIHLSISKSDL